MLFSFSDNLIYIFIGLYFVSYERKVRYMDKVCFRVSTSLIVVGVEWKRTIAPTPLGWCGGTMESHEFILHLGRAPKKGCNKYQGRALVEDIIDYRPSQKNRLEKGSRRWSHIYIYDLGEGVWIRRKSMPLARVYSKYTLATKCYYTQERNGTILHRGLVHKL